MPLEPRLIGRDGLGLVLAHRGASAAESENTLEAFEMALAVGADGVEFDVRLTADGIPVVMHDPAVERTTDGKGLVRDLTLDELKRLRIRLAGGGYAEVPTLAETLELLSGRGAADVEIKNIPGEPDFDPSPDLVVEAILHALDETSFVGPALLSSFDPRSIAHARALRPDVPTGLLSIEQVDAASALSFARSEGHPWMLPAAAAFLAAGETCVREAHEEGVRVGTWVLDDPDLASRALGWGIDAVATNDPAAIDSIRPRKPG